MREILDVTPGADTDTTIEVVRTVGVRFVKLEDPEKDKIRTWVVIETDVSGGHASGYRVNYRLMIVVEHKRPGWGRWEVATPLGLIHLRLNTDAVLDRVRICLASEDVLGEIHKPVELFSRAIAWIIAQRCVLEIVTGVGDTEEERSMITFLLREKDPPQGEEPWFRQVSNRRGDVFQGILELDPLKEIGPTRHVRTAKSKKVATKKRSGRK